MKEFFESRRLHGSIKITLSSARKLPGSTTHSKTWHVYKQDICAHVIDIVARYSRQGYTLTLRQLYYQLVSADIIPNDDIVYQKLSSILGDLRYHGAIDWQAIEDRGRVPFIPYHALRMADFMLGAKARILTRLLTIALRRKPMRFSALNGKRFFKTLKRNNHAKGN